MTEEVREALLRLTMCAREECEICKHKDKCGYDMQCELATQNMHIVLNALESRPKGEWEKHKRAILHAGAKEYVGGEYHECSNCKQEAEVLQAGGGCELLSDFCPNCGADMRGKE